MRCCRGVSKESAKWIPIQDFNKQIQEENTMKWKRINESKHNRYIVSYKVVKPFFNEVSVQADSEEDAINRALIGLKRDYKRAGEEIEDIEIIDVKPNSDYSHTNGFGYDDIDV